MQTTALEDKVNQLIADDIGAMGYELVCVKALSGGRYLTLQIMAERIDQKPMTVSDCAQISRAISTRLDEEKDLADRYTLEVNSPGIERPLVRLKDFERFTGHVARIELEQPPAGHEKKRRFQGSIVRITQREPEAEIELRTESGDLRVPVKTIARASLVITDALLKATKPNTKH